MTKGNVLADVGTDHGYIPIYLCEKKQIPRAIAMDINEGPLERAREHIVQYGLEGYIETRQSDGVNALMPKEADSILIAGMGGGLVLHILSDGEAVCRQAKELILQPQSELERVRAYLWMNGYAILNEEMVLEDEKFYPMMLVSYQGENHPDYAKNQMFCRYGKCLLQAGHPVLKQYLEKERQLYLGILESLKENTASEKTKARLEEVEALLEINQQAIASAKWQ